MTAHHGRLGCAQHVSCTDVALDDAFGDGLYDDASPSPVAAKRALVPNAGGQPSPKRRQGLELAGATPRFGRSAVPFLIDGQWQQNWDEEMCKLGKGLPAKLGRAAEEVARSKVVVAQLVAAELLEGADGH